MRLAGIGAVLFLAALLAPPAQAFEASADCAECPGGRMALSTLRAQLPAGWRLNRQREPVFGGEILVLDTGRPGDGRPTVLLVHGLGQNGLRDWLPVLPALAGEYRVLALDLPGFGFSDKPEGKYSPTNYARVLADLGRERVGGPMLVIGHSMGGAAALRLAADYPGQVSQLVLIDAAGILERTAFIKHATALPPLEDFGLAPLQRLNAGLRRFGQTLVEKAVGATDPTELLAQSDGAWGLLMRDKSNANAALGLVSEDFSEAVYTLLPPVELFWGEDDPVAPLRTGKVLAAHLPQARLTVLSGVGHNPMREAGAQLLPLLLEALQPRVFELESAEPAPGESLGDLVCKKESGRVYSGRYRQLRLEGCTEITLRDVQAESLWLRQSRVEAENLRVEGSGTALYAEGSVLRMTNGLLSGRVAIENRGSRLDLAGVALKASETALLVGRPARFLFSLCETDSPGYQGYLHGNRQLAPGAYAR
ncbi:MAG: alpha/beta hydrolase [Gammaproteobacteria bacterium]|nr:alpha/beta hydrolase [Gammaproteobacteria bacterium]